MKMKRCGFVSFVRNPLPAVDRRLLPTAFVSGDHPNEAHYVTPTTPVVTHKPLSTWKRAHLES